MSYTEECEKLYVENKKLKEQLEAANRAIQSYVDRYEGEPMMFEMYEYLEKYEVNESNSTSDFVDSDQK